jgi:TDG/mug DNA glycosylase family protein
MRPPTATELEAAYGKNVPDLIGPELRVLFCGINPSLYSAAVGHHFARPGNRFYKTLHQAGFTRRLLKPHEEQELLRAGFGITNLISRATASANELDADEYRRGAIVLKRKLKRHRPELIAFVGISAYRIACGNPATSVGPQRESFGGTRTWVLPNPSGLNAHYQLSGLVDLYTGLAREIGMAIGR